MSSRKEKELKVERLSVQAAEIMAEIRRRGDVSLPLLATHFSSVDETDLYSLLHALARARLVWITSENRGDIVRLSDEGLSLLVMEAKRRG